MKTNFKIISIVYKQKSKFFVDLSGIGLDLIFAQADCEL